MKYGGLEAEVWQRMLHDRGVSLRLTALRGVGCDPDPEIRSRAQYLVTWWH